MTHQLTSNHFTLQSLDFNANPALNKNAKCSALLVKANWCGHCTRYLPEFEEMSKSYPKVNFLIVEHDKCKSLLAQWDKLVNPAFKVQGFPTVVIYDSNGHPNKVVERNNLKQELSTMI